MIMSSLSTVSSKNGIDVLVIGDIFLDVHVTGIERLPFKWEQDCIVDNIEMMPGGSSANAARQLSAFPNVNVNFVSVTGKDQLSYVLRGLIADEKCKFTLNDEHCVSSTQTCIVITKQKKRCFITNRANLRHLNGTLIDTHLRDRTDRYSHVHVGGLYNCVGLHSMKFVRTLINHGYTHQISVDLQMNECQLNEQERTLFINLCSVARILFVNKFELFQLLAPPSDSMGEYEAMDRLISITANNSLIIVFKMGAKGSALRNTDGTFVHMSSQNIPLDVVDSTGAGDAFAAGFLSAYGNDNTSWRECLLWATATATLCIEQKGGCKKPIHYNRVLQRIKQLQANKMCRSKM